MQDNRRARLESVILEEMTIKVREVKDPRVPVVTLTKVEVSPDGGMATIFVSVLGGGTDRDMEDALKGLASATGFLRKHLAGVLTLRQVPGLVFKQDRGLENVSRVHELLKKIDDEKK